MLKIRVREYAVKMHSIGLSPIVLFCHTHVNISDNFSKRIGLKTFFLTTIDQCCVLRGLLQSFKTVKLPAPVKTLLCALLLTKGIGY